MNCTIPIFKLSFHMVIFPTEPLFSLRGTPGFCRTSFAIDNDLTSVQSDVSLKVVLLVNSVCEVTSVRKVKGEGSVWGDLGCFVNLPYFLVRYAVVPIMD
jgi:hypothetical protein